MLFAPAKTPTQLRVRHLNKIYNERQNQLAEQMTNKSAVKTLKKQQAKRAKAIKKSDKQVFVLDFDGDVKASAVQHFREEISTLITMAKPKDEVVIRLESPGGMVHSYGLAAAQITRLKEAELKVTVCVDKVAASGGYMMACVADKIVSAPFAVVGSVGVVAQMPNFYRLLKQHEVDYDVYTAGEYKRTVTVFGQNDNEDKAKFKDELEQTHVLFKQFVKTYRPKLDVNKIATGEHWYGQDALNLKLVDKLQTSDSYLMDLLTQYNVYALHSRQKPTLAEKLGIAAMLSEGVEVLADKLPSLLHQVNFDSRMNILAKK